MGAPIIVGAFVGAAVSKIGGSIVTGITGNKDLGNIVGMAGGLYAGGLASDGLGAAASEAGATVDSASTAFSNGVNAAGSGSLAQTAASDGATFGDFATDVWGSGTVSPQLTSMAAQDGYVSSTPSGDYFTTDYAGDNVGASYMGGGVGNMNGIQPTVNTRSGLLNSLMPTSAQGKSILGQAMLSGGDYLLQRDLADYKNNLAIQQYDHAYRQNAGYVPVAQPVYSPRTVQQRKNGFVNTTLN